MGAPYIMDMLDALKKSSEQNKDIANELSKKTDTSVLPNNGGNVNTKFRIANNGYTKGELWYFPLCTLPSESYTGNSASALISGRIGGYQGNNMSAISAIIWSRNGTGISLINFNGTLIRSNIEWEYVDIIAYENDDSTITVYLKCQGYFAFDLDLKLYHSLCKILYDGNHIASTPAGTFKTSASTSTYKAELTNGKLYVAGKQVALADDIPNYSNATESKAGLMSAEDKKKLDNIEDGAQKNVINVITVNGSKIEPQNGTVDLSIEDNDKLPLSGGEVTGNVQQSGASTDYSTYKFRNISFGTSSTPSSDATHGGSGSVYFMYT